MAPVIAAGDQPSGPAARPATGYPLTGDLLVRLVAGWGQVHGLVALEVFGHLGWVDGDLEQILVTAVRRLLPPG